MGVNQVGNAIIDDEVCCKASCQEIIRRYYQNMLNSKNDDNYEEQLLKLETIMKKANTSIEDRQVIKAALNLQNKTKEPAVAIQLANGQIVTGKTSKLMGASSAAILNALKAAGNIEDVKLLSSETLEPIQVLKTKYLKGNNPRLHTDEVLVALAMDSRKSELCAKAIEALPLLKDSEVHSSVILSEVDINVFKKLGMNLTMEPVYQTKKLYHRK